MFWGRREWKPDGTSTNESLHEKDTTPRLWDPATNAFNTLPKPGYNLFCSGHAFLSSGKLLVAGGHIKDSSGDFRATMFNCESNAWEPIKPMHAGRWYPNALTLPDGGILVSGGQQKDGHLNAQQKIWRDDDWKPTQEHNTLPLYPRMFSFDGKAFLAGHLKTSQMLDFAGMGGAGEWRTVDESQGQQREEGCFVMFNPEEVLIVGGGRPPQKTAERIKLSHAAPKWVPAGNMSIERRHHNATILPDGTVLVTGGTSGNGGFNDVSKPVKVAENWNPNTNQWVKWASETAPRIYHSTAVLLPDARVLSAGGGEFAKESDPDQANDRADSHLNAQIFSPPYLFKSTSDKPRPDIVTCPTDVSYNEEFEVKTSLPNQIAKANWIRLPSVTHSTNMNQRFNSLAFTVNGAALKVKSPANPNVCPPGHYMLFLLNADLVPSVARIVRIH
ncbi:hypothetical protein AYO47_01610 [Planctomyces sp. SCGC AG-212-M04]|nr:hypothetical protein AYO47_01610 [Planctomyces sp. SCGC AG-212-M04]